MCSGAGQIQLISIKNTFYIFKKFQNAREPSQLIELSNFFYQIKKFYFSVLIVLPIFVSLSCYNFREPEKVLSNVVFGNNSVPVVTKIIGKYREQWVNLL